MSLSNTAIARVTGVDVAYKNFNVGKAQFLPQRCAIIGQGATASNSTYTTDKKVINSMADVVEYGYGSPLYLACLQFFPEFGDGIEGIPITVYPLKDDAGGVAGAGDIGCTGTVDGDSTGTVYIGGVRVDFSVADNDLAAAVLGKIKTAIDAVLKVPVTTGTVADGKLPLTSKWKGASANKIFVDISELDITGLTFSKTAFSAGATNPSISAALTAIGEVWETFILNCLDYGDTTTLGLYNAWGEGRWVGTVKQPALVATGCIDDYATRTAITDAAARKIDRVNFLIQSTGSRELPCVIAARHLVKDILPTANDNPPQNYKGRATGLHTGADSVQESWSTRNNAVTLGASTNIKVGSVSEIADLVTMYHSDIGTVQSYRYVVDIVKLMNVVYNVRLIFESDDWKGVPLLDDGTPTTNPTAKQPKNAITVLKNLAQSLADNAIISDLAFTKANITAVIDSQNPKRLNTVFPVKLSGNAEVIDNSIYFGFYLGS